MSGGVLTTGAVVGDNYRLVRLLGEGGMGFVWEANHLSTGKRVALKVLKGAKDEDRRRFQREVRAAAAIRHPNVITVHEFIELPDGTLVIVMDLLDGETLGAVLRRDGRIALRDLAAVIVPVLAALEAAHSIGIVHRDLKPDNIFLCGAGDDLHVTVLDFGVAKLTATDGLAAKTQALTGTGSMVGTPYYMSPEQVFGDKDLDARADVWSLGVVMYECLSGIRPTEADTVGRVLQRIMVADFEPVTAHCPDLPDDVAAIIRRMLSPEREDRPNELTAITEVLARHKSARPPAFSRANDASGVDPRAATVPTPDAAPRPSDPQSRPGARAQSHSGSDVAIADSRNESTGRTTTNDAVSIVAAQPSRTKTRVVLAVGLATVAFIGGAIVLRGAGERGAVSGSEPSSTSPSASSDPPAVVAKQATSVAAPIADASIATNASAVSTAPPTTQPPARPPSRQPDANAALATKPAPSALATKPSPSVSPVAAGAVSGAPAPVCEAREVVTNGHCCPRGHVWSFGRCERPFATSF